MAGSAGKAELSRSPELVLRVGQQVELSRVLATSTAFSWSLFLKYQT